MVHIWQYQLNYNVKENGSSIMKQGGYFFRPLDYYAYHYHLVITKRNHLYEFNMEQQGDIIADEYMFRKYNMNFLSGVKVAQQDRVKVLQAFKLNPTIKNRDNLVPKSSNILKTVLDKGDW